MKKRWAKKAVAKKGTDRLKHRVNWREKPRWLLCIDPGTVTGYALYHDGVLVACGYGSFDDVIEMDLLPKGATDVVVLLEVPIAYPMHKSKADPNKLMVTCMRLGEFRYKYRALGCRIEQIYPNQWKGNIPKPERAEDEYEIETRVLERLDDEEKVLLYRSKSARAKRLDHNMIDAGGMGLWRLGRR